MKIKRTLAKLEMRVATWADEHPGLTLLSIAVVISTGSIAVDRFLRYVL